VEKLIRAGLRDPVLVSVREKAAKTDQEENASEATGRTPSALSNHYLIVDPPESKLALLVSFIRTLPAETKAMLFVSTCAAVEYVSLVLERLLKNSFNVMSIHGKKAKRDKEFDKFRKSPAGKYRYWLP
jgi:ATP-dependent RNA helicase DDX55/SPB4